MGQKYANNFFTTLTGNILAGDLLIPLASTAGLPGMGAGDYMYGALINASNAVEFFICTGISGSNLVIPAGGRGIGGSSASGYSTGDTVRIVLIKESLLQLQQESAASVVATGTDVYAATFSPVIRGYVSGCSYFIHFNNTNTVSVPTISFNGLAAINITRQNGAGLSAGDLPTEAVLRYDGTNMVLINLAVSPPTPDSFSAL